MPIEIIVPVMQSLVRTSRCKKPLTIEKPSTDFEPEKARDRMITPSENTEIDLRPLQQLNATSIKSAQLLSGGVVEEFDQK
jgi:hypothetical protein